MLLFTVKEWPIQAWGRNSEGRHMKRQLLVAMLMLGTACAAAAQDSNSDGTANQNVAPEFSASSTEGIVLFQPPAGLNTVSSAPLATPAPLRESADPVPPAPAPTPSPTFLYGGRDDFRWQLSLGADWIRFRSSVFDASAVGIQTAVTYFTNEWFGIEGNVAAGFAPQIFNNDSVRILIYGAGPKIAWRQRRWEPWAHALFGGAHEQPQVAGSSKSAFALKAGGGADYRFNPRFSGRLEADWARTNFFNESQNNFELMAGVVFHF
jgi:hypothetical protein